MAPFGLSGALAQQAQVVEVTGSRILRLELGSAVPTVALTADMLDKLGTGNVADLAEKLPQFGPALTRTSSTNAGPWNTGLNYVNLRNLGFSRALVLINGRRTIGGTSVTNAVDFSTLPTANIARVDVITGGASAVYGSDAISGVVNIVTKKNVEGLEVGAKYGLSERGDNESPSGYLMWGRRFGEAGRVLATAQIERQGQASCRDRELCSDAFLWTTPASPVRGPSAYSEVGPGGRFFIGRNAAGQDVSYTRRNGSVVDAKGALIPFVRELDGYNVAPERDLALQTRRAMLALEGELALGRSIRAYGELNHGQVEVTSQFESWPFQSGTQGSLYGTSPALQATIPLDNPFIPAPLRAALEAFNAAAPAASRLSALAWSQRFDLPGGPRRVNVERETTRLLLGLKGDLPALGNDWRWDAHVLDARIDDVARARGMVSTANLYHGLRVEPEPSVPGSYRCVDAAARAAGCVPINPFADYTPAMLQALRVAPAVSSGHGTLRDAVAYLGGTLAELPAGPLRAAAGLEWRRTSGYLDVAAVTNQATATGTPVRDTDLSILTTREAFVEALVPLLVDKPGIRALNLELALRRSEAGRFGYDTWKIGGDWEPVAGLRLRTMRARAVRAPEPRDLSGAGFGSLSRVDDPCAAARRSLSALRATHCAADGVPGNYAPPNAAEASVAGEFAANPGLTPEIGTTLTLGLVWEPPQLSGLSVAVDRFKIGVKDGISTLSRQITVDSCYDTAERLFCDRVIRGSNPLVPGANHVLLRVDQRAENVARQNLAGTDVDLRYRWSTAWGRFEAAALYTYYDRATLVPIEGAAAISLLGQAGQAGGAGWVRKTGWVNLGWTSGAYRANWNLRYVGPTNMSAAATAQGFPHVPEATYHNVRVGVAVAPAAEVFLGITNLADRKPPMFASGTSGVFVDTVPAFYDVFGRSYFVGARMTFR